MSDFVAACNIAARVEFNQLLEHAFSQLQFNGSGGFEADHRLKTVVFDFSFHSPFNKT
jgi:hypothetical protein